jgi:hypothetical protein
MRTVRKVSWQENERESRETLLRRAEGVQGDGLARVATEDKKEV